MGLGITVALCKMNTKVMMNSIDNSIASSIDVEDSIGDSSR